MVRPARTLHAPAFKASKEYMRAAKQLGRRLRDIRERRGLTLEDVEEKTDLNFRHVAKAEAGLLNLTLATMLRLAKGLGVSLATLFADELPATTLKEKAPRAAKVRLRGRTKS